VIKIVAERPYHRDDFTSVDIVEDRIRNCVPLCVELTHENRVKLVRYAGSVVYLMELARMSWDPDTFLQAALDLGEEHDQLVKKIGPGKVETARAFALAVIESRSNARRQPAES